MTAGRFCRQPPSVSRSMRYVAPFPFVSPMAISFCRTSADNSSQPRINSRTSAHFGTLWHCVTSDSASPLAESAVFPAFSAESEKGGKSEKGDRNRNAYSITLKTERFRQFHGLRELVFTRLHREKHQFGLLDVSESQRKEAFCPLRSCD